VVSPNTIGQRIRIARDSLAARGGARVSQAKLAKLCGWETGQTRIANYERDLRKPSAADVSKIARVTGCRPAWIMFGTLPAHDDQEAPPSTTPASAARATRARASKPPRMSVTLARMDTKLDRIGEQLNRIERRLK
jgi:transcriptional regulator with XRE-family HTH domain